MDNGLPPRDSASRGLSGAVALVTGAGGGIGRALCDALSHSGARVIGTGTVSPPDDSRLDGWWQLDVTAADGWKRVVTGIEREFGRLDCLINNAGVAFNASIAATSLEDWRRVMSVNVDGVLLGLQATLALLRDSGKDRAGGSSVVNISSTGALRGAPFAAAYCASKAALTLLSKSAAKEFAALGYPIRVNSLHPGATDTPMMEAVMTYFVRAGLSSSKEAQRAECDALSPLGRMARPDEIAGAAVFLCSSAASFMTGSDLVIDGGFTA